MSGKSKYFILSLFKGLLCEKVRFGQLLVGGLFEVEVGDAF